MSTDERKDHARLLDRARRPFEFLARAQQLRTDPPRRVDAYGRDGEVVWFADLPDHPAVATAHRGGDPDPTDEVLNVERLPRLCPPAPDGVLRPWLDGPVENPERPPMALTAIVRYVDGDSPGPGFFTVAQRLGLLPGGPLTDDDRLLFHVRHVREAFAAYATGGQPAR